MNCAVLRYTSAKHLALNTQTKLLHWQYQNHLKKSKVKTRLQAEYFVVSKSISHIRGSKLLTLKQVFGYLLRVRNLWSNKHLSENIASVIDCSVDCIVNVVDCTGVVLQLHQ